MKDDVLYGSKHRIITFQPSQILIELVFRFGRKNDVPQNPKICIFMAKWEITMSIPTLNSLTDSQFCLQNFFSISNQFFFWSAIYNNHYHLFSCLQIAFHCATMRARPNITAALRPPNFLYLYYQVWFSTFRRLSGGNRKRRKAISLCRVNHVDGNEMGTCYIPSKHL